MLLPFTLPSPSPVKGKERTKPDESGNYNSLPSRNRDFIRYYAR
jgi:hypothetical protein